MFCNGYRPGIDPEVKVEGYCSKVWSNQDKLQCLSALPTLFALLDENFLDVDDGDHRPLSHA